MVLRQQFSISVVNYMSRLEESIQLKKSIELLYEEKILFVLLYYSVLSPEHFYLV